MKLLTSVKHLLITFEHAIESDTVSEGEVISIIINWVEWWLSMQFQ